MAIRTEVLAFINDGPLPPNSASESVIARRDGQLGAIEGPISDEEAAALVGCFGPDDCFGLAWKLLHLVETAPTVPVPTDPPSASDNEWRRRLWDRWQRRQ